MDPRSVACRIYEPDGALLASGSCRMKEASGPAAVVRIAEHEAERIVHRYLFGAVREVRVGFDREPLVRGRLDRLQMTPTDGTLCYLRIEQPVGVPVDG